MTPYWTVFRKLILAENGRRDESALETHDPDVFQMFGGWKVELEPSC